MGMGKQNTGLFQDFFFFQRLNFFPILYKTTFKGALFQPEASKCKGALDFFILTPVIKTGTTAQIEQNRVRVAPRSLTCI